MFSGKFMNFHNSRWLMREMGGCPPPSFRVNTAIIGEWVYFKVVEGIKPSLNCIFPCAFTSTLQCIPAHNDLFSDSSALLKTFDYTHDKHCLLIMALRCTLVGLFTDPASLIPNDPSSHLIHPKLPKSDAKFKFGIKFWTS